MRYRSLTLYDSPYRAHDEGRAIDLFPEDGAPSPVAGEVIDVRTVRAPPKPYAPEHDHLIVIDTGTGPDGPAYRTPSGEPAIARIMHVDPAVGSGDEVTVGDDLGETVRAGFFSPWVDDHLHLGFRARDADPVRASGSLRVDLEPSVEPVPWDGTGTVVGTGDTYAILDRPDHPDPGERFAGIAGRSGRVGDERLVALDGGLPHYERGGVLSGGSGPVEFLGENIGDVDDRTIPWADVEVVVDGEPITGLSLGAHRDSLGAKLIAPDREFEVGKHVTVSVRSA